MTFVFIPYGTLLDKKRVDYLADKIRKNGGTTFLVNFFDWKPPSYVEVFIVVSKEMSFQAAYSPKQEIIS